ncbi:MAG: hypothetical protein AAGC55_23870, partial [Myxococcota bacterium]
RGRPIPHNDLPTILSNFTGRASERAIGCSDRPTGDRLGYLLDPTRVRGGILSPRYYDPEPAQALHALRRSHEIISVGELVDRGVLTISTGNEVGKLAYGTGPIPFIRTSDISNWEIKISPKHCVSDEIYHSLREKQDVRTGDILMVKDGSYLIGECAYISRYDEKIVYQSHIYKIRTHSTDRFNPFLLLALLSCDQVKRQVQAKRFTQDIIDSLGRRVLELELPVPRCARDCAAISTIVERSVAERIKARELARQAALAVIDLAQARPLAESLTGGAEPGLPDAPPASRERGVRGAC